MLSYILRRILLIPPTLIGMTAIVFFALAMAPGGIGASLLSRTGEMRPDERRAREEYLNQRYGLNKPKHVQYLRWLNKVSPIGFKTYDAKDPRVLKAAADELAARKPVEDQMTELRDQRAKLSIKTDEDAIAQLSARIDVLDQQRKAIDLSPDAGDINVKQPTLKWPDLGDSFARGRKVNILIGEALPKTLMLQLIALPISYSLAIWLGIQQARRRGSTFDYVASGTSLALWSVPSIWVGVLLIGFFANEEYFRWFPTTGLNSLNEASMTFLPSRLAGEFQPGWLLDRIYHLILPIICLTYANFAFLSRLTRGALLDNLNADFVRTARAKGLHERIVLYRHAFRNSLIPLITVLANILPALIGGSVIVENIFGINGMGKLAVEAAFARDFELLLSETLVVASLQLTGFLLADISFAIADPRVSYG
jgi:ABC-type dipeptide/oligopeptide/nickel transport system permease component